MKNTNTYQDAINALSDEISKLSSKRSTINKNMRALVKSGSDRVTIQGGPDRGQSYDSWFDMEAKRKYDELELEHYKISQKIIPLRVARKALKNLPGDTTGL